MRARTQEGTTPDRGGLVAGRTLDARVAVEVFGLPRSAVLTNLYYEQTGKRRTLPRYSTDIAAAWEVVRHWTALGYKVRLNTTFSLSDGLANGWVADIGGCAAWTSDLDALPSAICRASLDAAALLAAVGSPSTADTGGEDGR